MNEHLPEKSFQSPSYEVVEINGRKFQKIPLREVLEIGPEDPWPIGFDGRPIRSEKELYSHNGPYWDFVQFHLDEMGLFNPEDLPDEPYVHRLIEDSYEPTAQEVLRGNRKKWDRRFGALLEEHRDEFDDPLELHSFVKAKMREKFGTSPYED